MPAEQPGTVLNNRRTLLKAALGAALIHPISLARGENPVTEPGIVRPPRLTEGDLTALVNPASARYEVVPTEIMAEAIEALGLTPRRGANYYARRGYMAGTDQQRADDINAAFADPQVKAIWATGGWGSARVLPYLDYDQIAQNPKVLVGYSDATALLSAVHAKTGLVTFHGPFPRSRVSATYQRDLLLEGRGAELRNPQRIDSAETVVTEHRIRTLRGGVAEGKLVGGNLTVLSAIVGSAYLPSFDGAILFLEDVNEAVYRVDRMLTQLRLAGILDRISGFIFGNCTECDPGAGHGSLTLEEVLRDHIEPLGVPAWTGAMIGHIRDQFTLPIGVHARIDADLGEIRFGSAVQ